MLPEAQAIPAENGDAPHLGGVPLYSDGGREKTRFTVKGYQDVWATVLFLLCAGGVTLALMGVGIKTRLDSPSTPQTAAPTPPWFRTSSAPAPDSDPLPIHFSSIFSSAVAGLAVIVALVFAVLALFMSFPYHSIVISNAAVGVLLAVAGAVAILGGSPWGVLLLAMGVVTWLWVYSARDRIPFSASLLHTSTTLLKRYPSIYSATAGVALLVFFHFGASLAALLSFLPERNQEPSAAQSTGMLAVLAIHLWATQVATGVLHTTSAGVGATWYFCAGAMPSNPTLKSFARATTTSFGSVCFGSLLVTTVKMIRIVVQAMTRNGNAIVRCMVNCFLGCIEALVRLFNDYAFAHVAIYGCGYVEAARATWELTHNCGATVLFTHALVSNTLLFTTVIGSAAVAAVWGAVYQSWSVGLAMFFLCAVAMFCAFRPIRSYIIALLVCYAEVPLALQESSPAMYAKLASAEIPVGTVA